MSIKDIFEKFEKENLSKIRIDPDDLHGYYNMKSSIQKEFEELKKENENIQEETFSFRNKQSLQILNLRLLKENQELQKEKGQIFDEIENLPIVSVMGSEIKFPHIKGYLELRKKWCKE